MSESNKRISFPICLFDEEQVNQVTLTSEMHVVPVGKWDHPAYGEMEITTDAIKKFVENFRAKIRLDLPITAGHDTGMSGGELPAIGWFKELVDKGVNGLYAFVEWTDEGKRLIRDGAFKYFSPEFYQVYEDPESRQKYEFVLVGGALTNKPYFKELEPVVAFSEEVIINQFNLKENKNMDLKTILAKKADELSAEEKAFVIEHKAELSAEESEAFKSVIETPAAETAEEKAAREQKEAEDAKAAQDAKEAANVAAGLNPDGTPKEVSASEKGKVVTLSEAEVTALRARADLADKTFAELDAMKLGVKVEKMLFSESNKDGRFLPKEKNAVVSFMKSLSETQRDQFTNLVNLIPKSEIFKEVGDSGDVAPTGASAIALKLDTLAKAKQKEFSDKNGGKILKYSEALRLAQKENPELVSEYNKSGAEVK